MTNTMEQALLLPKDMANLKSMRKHEVFLSLKRDLAMVSPLTPSLYILIIFLFFITSFSSFVTCFSPWQVVQATYRADEMVNYSYRQMKEEEGTRIAAMEAFHVAEKSNQELKSKLTEAERDRKSVEVALDNAKRQAEGQRVLLRQAKDQLAASKE